jgi:hypothetical protein
MDQKLPRRHRYRRRAPRAEAGGVMGETKEDTGEGSGRIPEVLRFERVKWMGTRKKTDYFLLI